MEIHGKATRRILFKDLRIEVMPQTYMYGIRLFPLNSIKTILDLGSNIGFYSMAFKFFQPNARIISIEPDKNNFNLLVRNVSNLRIEAYNIALGPGGKVGKIRGRFSTSHRFAPEAPEINGNEKCLSFLLNNIIEKYKINCNNLFIKVDVEGAEQFIFNHLPSEEIIKKSLGTSMEVHRMFKAENVIQWAEDKFSNTHDICVHRGKATHLSIFSKNIKLLTS